MKKDGEKQNCFDASIDISKVIDLSKITFTKKKRKEPYDDKENIKKPEDISKKEKKEE
jgi:hypothetical protein